MMKKIYILVCLFFGVMLIVYGDQWKQKREIRVVQETNQEKVSKYYEFLEEKTKHSLTPFALKGSIWESKNPEMLVQVDKEHYGNVKVIIDYLGSKKVYNLAIVNGNGDVNEYYIDSYIQGRHNFSNGESIFLISIEGDKMYWYDFYYVIARNNGVNQYKRFHEISFDRKM